MCGRYNFTGGGIDITDSIEALNKKYGYNSVMTGEIRPTNIAAVLLSGLEPAPVRWGFPKWDGKGVAINAVNENVFEKRMLDKSVLERRCVIPSTGFYQRQEVEAPINKVYMNLTYRQNEENQTPVYPARSERVIYGRFL